MVGGGGEGGGGVIDSSKTYCWTMTSGVSLSSI